ncbi:MAG: DUF1156 domain-containing protein [Planctomycetes bacterium]|nr:DUF1156 domain-containing protein [Planctomycetota bacterium]
MTPYPKRLIEVDFPIARISAHARREKSIRHGHISTLHIWWARRPLASCRAVILASLWPDPVDLAAWAKEANAKGEVRAPRLQVGAEPLKPGEGAVIRPKRFLDEARQRMTKWSQIALGKASNESYKLLVQVSKNPKLLDDPATLRTVLLDFIADCADWDHSTDKDYLDTSRALVQAAHEAVGGASDSKPMVVDPFAGGGSIPLEAVRVGAEAFASDLNPIAVILNRFSIEQLQKYGDGLAVEARKWGAVIGDSVAKRLDAVYPKGEDGSTPLSYMWARTVVCEGTGCGVRIPMLRRAMLRSGDSPVAIGLQRDGKSAQLTPTLLRGDAASKAAATCSGFSVTCPLPSCGYTTPKKRVQAQLAKQVGGADDAQLLAVFAEKSGQRFYRPPTDKDLHAIADSQAWLGERSIAQYNRLDLPNEPIPQKDSHRAVGSQLPLYGFRVWADLFTARQLRAIRAYQDALAAESGNIRKVLGHELAEAVIVLMAFAIDRQVDYLSSLCRWVHGGEFVAATLGGEKKLPMLADFAEANPTASASGCWSNQIDWIARYIERESVSAGSPGQVAESSAEDQVLPDDCVAAFITDPPYYDSVPYAELSDFYYVWLRRTLGNNNIKLLHEVTPKGRQATVNHPKNMEELVRYRDILAGAFLVGRREAVPGGIGVIVFAHKSTSGWEALLEAIIKSGWVVTASWPIDTERGNRMNALNTASLNSSVHIVCRPRESAAGDLSIDSKSVGEWREVLSELPSKIAEWMPRLAAEKVVGADAIFACLGPALEVFSRWGRVEKANGEIVPLREYLEQVWAVVSNEALSMIFKEADAAGLEPDARLTAMWLWTLGGGKPQSSSEDEDDEEAESNGEEATSKQSGKVAGFVLEFDAARKIAQGLGIHLEKSESIVEVKGDSARLLPVSERARYLFGKEADDDATNIKARKAKKKVKQSTLFEELDAIEAEVASAGGRFGGLEGAKPGATVLDKVHQAMIFFAGGRSEALKRFLGEDGVGKEARFWKLAQSLSALYPATTDEKRWVDGVLARKKGLGY